MIRATRLMILGATHLGRGDQGEPDQALESIVDRIVRWRPDALAIEVLPGELVDSYLRLGGPFADMRVGGMPQAAACAEAVRELHSWDLWGARDAGQDRTRELSERVVAWCAAFEPYTALLLARRAPGLPAPVRAALAEVEARGVNEVASRGRRPPGWAWSVCIPSTTTATVQPRTTSRRRPSRRSSERFTRRPRRTR